MRRRLPVALLAVIVLTATSLVRHASTAVPPPLIGANYTHYAYPNCGLDDGIIAHYHEPGVRRLVRAQLAAMRAAGVQTLRLLLWHMTDATGQTWGIVSSGGGWLAEPYRSNLIRYLSDVRKAGFVQLTLVFGPEADNAPLGGFYNPAKFDENWQFVRDVRPLLKRYGPASTRVDLLNEGAPPSWESATNLALEKDYDTRTWSNYVHTFGGADATISSVGADGPYDTADRLQNLVDALRASGKPFPRWFDVHPPYSYDGTLSVLQAVDATLSADGLSQPLVIGEEAYNDEPVARAIKEFIATSSRRVLEVMEWPLSASGPCSDVPVSPPFRVDAYITTLTGAPAPSPTPSPLPLPPIPTLYASVGPGRAISFRTTAGRGVATLDAGEFRVVVRDRSAVENFHLVGPDVARKTGVGFRGTVVWRLDIGLGSSYGSTYAYFSDGTHRRLHGSFRIH